MAGKLTTHVLDTALGVGAAEMRVEWRRLDAGGRATLIPGPELIPGTYEIVFFVGDYHRLLALLPNDAPFLDEVPVRFGIADADSHYHVPLVVSPFGYSTYRGG
jgi:5-hydroxyisourate hydrolase